MCSIHGIPKFCNWKVLLSEVLNMLSLSPCISASLLEVFSCVVNPIKKEFVGGRVSFYSEIIFLVEVFACISYYDAKS